MSSVILNLAISCQYTIVEQLHPTDVLEGPNEQREDNCKRPLAETCLQENECFLWSETS